MTRAEAKWAIANPETLKAMADGNAEWRFGSKGTWCPANHDSPVTESQYEFRAKPEPKFRPWKPEEVPVGARYRRKGETAYCQTILGFTPAGVTTSADDQNRPFDLMFDRCEYSTDGGKTFKPCGVLDNAS